MLWLLAARVNDLASALQTIKRGSGNGGGYLKVIIYGVILRILYQNARVTLVNDIQYSRRTCIFNLQTLGNMSASPPLAGIRVLEFAGLAPGKPQNSPIIIE